MYKLNLTVNNETVFRVVRFVMDNPNRPQDAIARGCGVSTKTVSKIIKFFLDKDLFYKHLLKEDGATSRSYRICINPKYNFLVYYLNGNRLTVSMIDLLGSTVSKNCTKLNSPLKSKEINDFIDNVLSTYSLTRFQYRIGYSFIIGPNSASNDYAFAAKLSKQLRRKIENKEKNYPYSKRFISDTSLNMAKTELQNRSAFSSDVIMYIRFNVNELYYFVTDKTNTIVDQTRIDLSDCTYTDESSERTLRLIEDCVSAFSVTKVLIDSDDYTQIGGIKIILKQIAEENNSPIADRLKIIQVINSDPSLTEIGAGRQLMDMFYESIVKKLSE